MEILLLGCNRSLCGAPNPFISDPLAFNTISALITSVAFAKTSLPRTCFFESGPRFFY